MKWRVEFSDEFLPEFNSLSAAVREELLAHAKLLQQFGPQPGRPWVDALKGSKYSNLKELRFGAAHGEWRVAFAFDTRRIAVLLAAGDKPGVPERKFYDRLIRKADKRYLAHISRLKTGGR